MLFAVLAIYMGIWGCAYVAARGLTGRVWFVVLYLIAVLGVPNLFGAVFWAVYGRTDPAGASDFTRILILMGMAMGAVFYPLIWWRTRRAG